MHPQAQLEALANPTRWNIMRHLLQSGEQNASQVHRALNLAQPSTSKHLAILTRAGLLERRNDGTNIFYKVPVAARVMGDLAIIQGPLTVRF